MKISQYLNKRKILWMTLIIIALLVAASFSIIRHNNTYFTVDKWDAYSWNDRQLLINSFLKQYSLNQMTKGEILELLGHDTAYGSNLAVPFKTAVNLVYDFGLQRNTAASNMTLIISFDDNDRVSSYELKTYSQ